MRKAFDFRILIIAATVLGLLPAPAFGFGLSENESFKQDVRAAVARAKDFKRTQEQMKKEEGQYERFADQARRDREKFDEIRERERERYVEWRAKQPDQATEDERREKIFLEKMAKEEARMEKSRQRYVEKRETVRRVREKDGFINEIEEYGLEYKPENLARKNGEPGPDSAQGQNE
jgi:hypothetical protein